MGVDVEVADQAHRRAHGARFIDLWAVAGDAVRPGGHTIICSRSSLVHHDSGRTDVRSVRRALAGRGEGTAPTRASCGR